MPCLSLLSDKDVEVPNVIMADLFIVPEVVDVGFSQAVGYRRDGVRKMEWLRHFLQTHCGDG